MKLLDSVDNNINSDQPMLQGLTNGGPANLGIPMNLPAYEPQTTTSGVFGSTPALLQDLSIEDDDEWSDTDPMSFEDDQIFENSAFLGIGKKAKARKAVRKEKRVAKREARRASKNAEIASIGADSAWKQPNEINPDTYNPLAVAPPATENPAMLNTLNDQSLIAGAQSVLRGAGYQLGNTEYTFEDEPNYSQNNIPNQPSPKKNNTVLYIAAAIVLVVLVIILKRK